MRVIEFRRNFGQTAAFAAGFAAARGRLIATADGDLQNDPRDLPAMVERLESGFDIVCGWRKDRKDRFLSRRLPSLIANRLISWTTGVRLNDYGCSLKVFRAEVVKPLRLYGEMHRFLPALASEMGVRIAEQPVNHRARVHGSSKYGISRTVRVMLDLLTVKFLLSYSTRPLQMFGVAGFILGGLGGLILLAAGLRPAHRVPLARETPALAAVRDSARVCRAAAGHARASRGNAGPDLPRGAGKAHLRGSPQAAAGERPWAARSLRIIGCDRAVGPVGAFDCPRGVGRGRLRIAREAHAAEHRGPARADRAQRQHSALAQIHFAVGHPRRGGSGRRRERGRPGRGDATRQPGVCLERAARHVQRQRPQRQMAPRQRNCTDPARCRDHGRHYRAVSDVDDNNRPVMRETK